MSQSLPGHRPIVESPCITAHCPLRSDRHSLRLGNDASEDETYGQSAQDVKIRLGVVNAWGSLPQVDLRHVSDPAGTKGSDSKGMGVCVAVRTDPAAILVFVRLLVRGRGVTAPAALVSISSVLDVASAFSSATALSRFTTAAAPIRVFV